MVARLISATGRDRTSASVAATLAEVKGLPVAEIARATTENFFRLFAKAAPAKAGVGARAPACG